ncbi:hypothetical protein FQR65_LT13004 [Abscondita terminalis]|nr:hypothetical protein FQR65_LT13004 [Abscondita terminalis]
MAQSSLVSKYIPPHRRRHVETASACEDTFSNDLLSNEKLYIKYPFEKIKELSNKEPKAIIREIMLHHCGFEYLIDHDLSEDGIELMMETLANACLVEMSEDKSFIAHLASKDKFHNCVLGFISKITKTELLGDDLNKFFKNAVTVFQLLLEYASSRACKVLPETKEAWRKFLPNVYDDELRTNELFRELNEKLRELAKSDSDDSENGTSVDNLDEEKPPNDFRDLSIYPTENEILSPGYLRKNVIDRSFENVHHYLDVHFRLLKEDYVLVIREGIEKFVGYTGTLDPIIKSWGTRIYPKVKFLRATGQQGVLVQIQNVSSHVYDLNKIFNEGALLCFSNDHFKSLFVGEVISRNIEKLGEVQVAVKFDHEKYEVEKDYVMTESCATFHTYYPVLKTLQNIHEDQFPMKKYIVDLNSDIDDVKYLNDIRTIDVNNMTELNATQLKAFHAALTKELVIIQGATGTGKTFLGIKLLKTLLTNKENWYRSYPILVLCRTKYELGTFFERLSAFTDDMIFLNRLENQNLQKFTLAEKRKNFLRTCANEYADVLRDIKSKSVVINLKIIFKNEHNFPSSWFSNASNQEMIDWLLGDIDSEETPFKTNKDSHIKVNAQNNQNHIMITVSDLKKKIEDIKEEETEKNVSLEEKERSLARKRRQLEMQLHYLKKRLRDYDNINIPSKPHNCNLQNPHFMNADDRWQLYWYWLRDYEKQLKDDSNFEVMKRAMIVGVTTDMAVNRLRLLHKLKSPIVIVNETSQILESTVVVCLTPFCKQLILFGDHQQMGPNYANVLIGDRYNLRISLFERLVSNELPCHVLGVQYNMEPNISNLLVPFYPNLKNHHSVYNFPSIVGVVPRVYFIDHRYQEESDDGYNTFNKHETNFLTSLARYLIQNGHKPEDITIVSTTKGQWYALQKQKHNLELQKNIQIQLINQLEQKTNKIILLSLVRNNDEGSKGIANLKNIVCVALSRAREGLYMMGNMDMLCVGSEVWLKLKDILISQSSLGPSLLLRCQIHTDRETKVTLPEDFDNVSQGGCNQICGTKLPCGHFCTMVCHTVDRDHRQKFGCNKCI